MTSDRFSGKIFKLPFPFTDLREFGDVLKYVNNSIKQAVSVFLSRVEKTTGALLLTNRLDVEGSLCRSMLKERLGSCKATIVGR